MEEIWRDIPQYKGFYQVSNLGRVKSLYGWNGHSYMQKEKILKPTTQYMPDGYKREVVNLMHKTHKVHRLVAEVFIPKIEGKNYINHKDFNTLNNTVDNLEWVTQKENINWNIINKRNSRYKYIDKSIVIKLYKQGITAIKIAEQLGVNKCNIDYIVSKNNISRADYKRKSKYIDIDKLKKLFLDGLTNQQIARVYHIPSVYIARRRYQMKKGEI